MTHELFQELVNSVDKHSKTWEKACISNTYSLKEFDKLIGRTTNTLQKWDREGTLKAHRSPTYRRHYTPGQYLVYRGFVAKDAEVTVAYTTVLAWSKSPTWLTKQVSYRSTSNSNPSRSMRGCLISAVA